MNKIVFAFITLIFNLSLMAQVTAEDVSFRVNMGAAVASLENTIDLYAEGRYSEAMFQADLGAGYAPKIADFPYLKALCAHLSSEPTIYCLDYLNVAFSDEMSWYRYGVEDAKLLAATLNLKLKRYNEALRLIASMAFEQNDASLIKAAALYGLSRQREAEDVILSALDRHSFDPRFPKLFLIQEKDRKKTAFTKNVASRILENLYVWKDSEPILLPLSVNFEDDDKINRRNLKIYREMHTHFLPSYTPEELFLVGESILSNINYGVLSDEASIRELFSLKVEIKDLSTNKKVVINAVYKDHLLQLSKIVGASEARELIKGILSNYSGVVLEDENKDGILESILYYKSGRPDLALFDRNQVGYPEFIAECNFGIPKKVLIGEVPYTLIYDEYPFVSSVQMKDDFFQMRPRSFKWQPFTLERLRLMLFSDVEKHKSFFVLSLNSSIKEINDSTLMNVAAYKESMLADEKERVFYDRGKVISCERRVDNVILSLINYKNGRPSIKKSDIDRDSYFEKIEEFDLAGNVVKISIDFNKDGIFEYNEIYERNGIIRKEWTSGLPNGRPLNKIVYTVYPSSDSVVQWTHPLDGKIVKLHYSKDEPNSVDIAGSNFPVFKDNGSNVYWFRSIPAVGSAISKILEEKLEKKGSPILSCIVEVGGGAVFAVKSGDAIFAEFVSD